MKKFITLLLSLCLLLLTTTILFSAGTKEEKIFRIAVFDGPQAPMNEDLFEKFKEITGVDKVEQERVPWVGMHEKYVTALTSGGYVYDAMYQVYRTELELAEYYEDLGPFLAKDPGPMKEVIAACLKSGVSGNRRHAIPVYFAVNAVHYRTDLFKAAGITPNPNWDFDEFLDVIKKLETSDVKGIVLSGVTPQLFKPWVSRYWGMGGHLYTKDWKPLPQRDMAVKSLQHMKDTYDLAPDGVLAYTIPDAVTFFAQGRAAMIEDWATFIWKPLQDPEQSVAVDKWSILPIPGGACQIAGPWGWAIPKTAKYKDEAWEWIKLVSSLESQRMGLLKYNVFPSKASVYKDPEVLGEMPWMKDYLKAAEGGRLLPRTKTAHVMIEALNERAGAVLSGTMTPKKAIDEIFPIWVEQAELGKPDWQYTTDYFD